MGDLELLKNEGLDLDWEVTKSLLNEVQMLHHFAHDNIEGLKIVFSSRVRKCHHELVGKLIEKVVGVAQEFHKVGILVKRVWKVL